MGAAFVASGVAALVVACGTTPTATTGTSPLVLQAYGGPAGTVSADVPIDGLGVGPNGSCASPITAGACVLTDCTFGSGGVAGPPSGEGDFGPMSATAGGTSVAITYSGEAYVAVDFPSSVSLGTGGTMTFHGEGGTTVPGFEVSATIPGLAVITSPIPATAGGATLVDTTHDLTVTWMPIAIGNVQFEVGATILPDAAATQLAVQCAFEGTAGGGVVPQTLLSSLKTMAGANPAHGSLSSELEATTVVDGLTIVTQSFQQEGSNGAGQFDVTLQ
jgi:hypothetical protein